MWDHGAAALQQIDDVIRWHGGAAQLQQVTRRRSERAASESSLIVKRPTRQPERSRCPRQHASSSSEFEHWFQKLVLQLTSGDKSVRHAAADNLMNRGFWMPQDFNIQATSIELKTLEQDLLDRDRYVRRCTGCVLCKFQKFTQVAKYLKDARPEGKANIAIAILRCTPQDTKRRIMMH